MFNLYFIHYGSSIPLFVVMFVNRTFILICSSNIVKTVTPIKHTVNCDIESDRETQRETETQGKTER